MYTGGPAATGRPLSHGVSCKRVSSRSFLAIIRDAPFDLGSVLNINVKALVSSPQSCLVTSEARKVAAKILAVYVEVKKIYR